MRTIASRAPISRRKRSHDVADEIERLITAGEYSVGEQLPSEKDLMARFGVGRQLSARHCFSLSNKDLSKPRAALGHM